MASGSRSMEGVGVGAGLRSFEVPEPGQILGDRYELVSWIGEGTFGEVWKVLDLRLGITVAAKLAKSGASTARFAEEVRLLAKLQHPGVVTLRDQWDPSSPDARPFFVMDYCESNLKKWIAETTSAGGFDIDAILAIFLEVCRTVSLVHERGTLHRDLKPSNVLLLRDEDRLIPKLADFGQAGGIPEPDRTATEGLGTAYYQSPEQGLLGTARGPASDVFALAVILYEMLTGQPTPDPARAWWKIVAGASLSPASEDPRLLPIEALRSSLSRRVPEAVVQALAQALSLNPESRPSALELGTGFDRALREMALTAWRRRSGADRGYMSVVIPLTNAFGYLFAAGRPVLLDPKLTTRRVYHARTYPHAWLILPLCAFVLVGTWLAFRYVDMRRRWWVALVPLVLAAAATLPILKPEMPHGAIVSDTPMWLAINGLWLAAHYAFNVDAQRRPSPAVVQSLRFLFVGSLVAGAVTPIPIMLFQNWVFGTIVPDSGERSLLGIWSQFQVGTWEIFWLIGPTREVGAAWFRALRASKG